MAIYRTTDTELTSIANAIRTKTGGNSPLIYPTGFVDAIDSIIPYNYLGSNATYISTPYNQTFKLSDTNFNASQISTSYITLKDSEDLSAISLSSNYQYVTVTLATVDYKYTNEAETKSRIEESYFISLQPFGAIPNNFSDLQNETFSYISYPNVTNSQLLVFYNSGGSFTVGAPSNMGIYFSPYNPGLTNRSSSTFICTIKTPVIRAISQYYYMSTDSYNALIANETTLNIKIDLYQVDNNYFSMMNRELIRAYQQKHSIT